MICTVSGCEKKAAKGGLCWMHLKRRQRRKPLSAPPRTYDPRETLMAAVRAYAESDSDEDFEPSASWRSKIQRRIERAAIRYARAVQRFTRRSTQCPPPPKE